MKQTKQGKLLISGGLTIFAVVLALAARRPSCFLGALAMGTSTLGEALLAGYPGCFKNVENRLTKGGLVFLAAHILYICALLVSSGREAGPFLSRFALPFAGFFCLTALLGAIFYIHGRSSVSLAFFIAAFLYLLTVGVHAAVALTISGQSGGGYMLSVAGTLLFYLSDAILLAREFKAVRGKHITALIWLTYVPAQFCLVLGLYLR